MNAHSLALYVFFDGLNNRHLALKKNGSPVFKIAFPYGCVWVSIYVVDVFFFLQSFLFRFVRSILFFIVPLIPCIVNEVFT